MNGHEYREVACVRSGTDQKMKAGLTRRGFLHASLRWVGAGAASAIGVGTLAGCRRQGEGPTPTGPMQLMTATVKELSGTPDVPTPRKTSTATPLRAPTKTPEPLREAMFYRQLHDKTIQCQVCFRQCVVQDGDVGFCLNKRNMEGRYYSLVYGHPLALQIDPIEKEPSFHMLPGATIFCTGTASCNQRCKFCQNWELSQRAQWEVVSYDATPEQVVHMALMEGCDAVSFTYNEPTVFYEQMFETAAIAKERGLGALFHTNGTMNPEPLAGILDIMDAITVDLKAFTPEFYQEISSSELWPVLRTLENVRKTDKHLEIVNLVIPTKNDDLGDIRRMCVWIRDHLGEDTPLHFTRFFPAYKFQRLPPTPVETLEQAAAIAGEEGLKYVYIGNVPGHKRNSTFCPACHEIIIARAHFFVFSVDVVEGKCRYCGESIPGVWWDV